MYRTFLLLLVFTTVISHAFSQTTKPIINQETLSHWPSLAPGGISTNGKYVYYFIRNQENYHKKLVIQELASSRLQEYSNTMDCKITDNNKTAVILCEKDTLRFCNLENFAITTQTNISNYNYITLGPMNFAVYLQGTQSKSFCLNNLTTGKTQVYPSVKRFEFNREKNILLLFSDSIVVNDTVPAITCLVQKASEYKVSWQHTFPKQAHAFTISNTGQQLAYINSNTMQLYHANNTTQTLANANHLLNSENITIHHISGFSDNGKHLFYTITTPTAPQPETKGNEKAVQVDIWSYKDKRLQSEQLTDISMGRTYLKTFTCVYHLPTHTAQQLEQDSESLHIYEGANDSWAIVTREQPPTGNELPGLIPKAAFILASTITGERFPLLHKPLNLSASGKYLLCYEPEDQNYYILHMDNKKWINITSSIPIQKTKKLFADPSLPPSNEIKQQYTWLKDDKALWLYDSYDILEIDPEGKKAIHNITQGYGRSNKISFYPITKNVSIHNDTLILNAFNILNKQNGFFRLIRHQHAPPELLTMNNYLYQINPTQGNIPPTEFPIQKAGDNNLYLVQRCKAAESPNYFTTTDFIHFTAVTHIAPEKAYNWLTSELLTGTTTNGLPLQAILYKPENFDSTQKYPVIIHYYEKVTTLLNSFKTPELSAGYINIPWLVSQGYLVCTPDIYYQYGKTGASAMASVEGAVNILKQFAWVNTSRIGIQGHSFGGFETNFIISHSNLFACAMASAGISDMASAYNSIYNFDGKSNHWLFEYHQLRMFQTLWASKEDYIDNSAVYSADKIQTPLLIMSNKNDGLVPFTQGLELFLSLRRLNKPVWMLQYDNEGHNLIQPSNQLDFTIRLNQFFDHFLKGAGMPEWMSQGIEARYKGIKTGL